MIPMVIFQFATLNYQRVGLIMVKLHGLTASKSFASPDSSPSFFSRGSTMLFFWEFQDPKMEALYYI